jgi:hypothetical protein
VSAELIVVWRLSLDENDNVEDSASIVNGTSSRVDTVEVPGGPVVEFMSKGSEVVLKFSVCDNAVI